MASALLPADRGVRRLVQLYAGLVAYALSMALIIRSGLGSMPWDVLHQGLSARTGLSLGVATVLVSALVLVAWIPLRQRPDLGTVSSIVVIGIVVDPIIAVVPDVDATWARASLAAAGIALNAIATAAYIGVRLGSGPRDGLMTGLAMRSRRSIRSVRTVIEVTVVVTGCLLGGTLGVATVLYAVSVGALIHAAVPHLTLYPQHPTSTCASRSSPRPATAEAGEHVDRRRHQAPTDPQQAGDP